MQRPRSVSRRPSRGAGRLLAPIVVLLAAAGAAYLWLAPGDEALPPEVENSLFLANLPANRWIKYHEETPGSWSRQGHAGLAFDSKRGTLLVFGSDTHGEDWDNSVHEFDPRRRRWETHQPAAGPETYRSDETGAPIAGSGVPMPWAMHTYDAIEYHPGLDALVVLSTIEHNPRAGSVPGVKRQPTWIYELAARRWRALGEPGSAAPTFFGGSAAFDKQRGILVAYRHGLWELDATGRWHKASSETRHGMHHSLVYDSRRGELVVFGDYRPTGDVWRYGPGAVAGAAGRWVQLSAKDSGCPPMGVVPVAYAAAQDVFVLVVNEPVAAATPGARPTRAATVLFDPVTERCAALPAAELPPVGMNFMMAWDGRHDVVFLVTGEPRGAVTVWALKPRK